jgi:hypothetical protein
VRQSVRQSFSISARRGVIRVDGKTPPQMILALVEPIDVHLTGGNALGSQLLIAAIALIGVLITVLTANWRHHKQLEEDRALRADDLAHDRHMRDREHIRMAVDKALDRLTESVSALSRATTAAATVEDIRDEEREAEATGDSERQLDLVKEAMKAEDALAAALGASHQATTAQMQASLRLRMWVGADEPITDTHADLADQLRGWHAATTAAVESNRDEQQQEHEAAVRGEVPERVRDFEQACWAYFAS